MCHHMQLCCALNKKTDKCALVSVSGRYGQTHMVMQLAKGSCSNIVCYVKCSMDEQVLVTANFKGMQRQQRNWITLSGRSRLFSTWA